MEKYIKIIVFFVGIFILSNAGSSEGKHPIDKRMEEAADKDISTKNLKESARKALQEWEQEMNKYYSLLLGELDDEGKGALIKSQENWQKYYNSEATFISVAYGRLRGTFFDIKDIEDRVGIVRKRALDLKSYYDLIMEERAGEDARNLDKLFEVLAEDERKKDEQGIRSWTDKGEMAYWKGVKLDEVTVKGIYQEFKDTIPSPPPPGYAEYTIENGEEALTKTKKLGKSLHNLFLVMNEEDFDKYGRLIGLMREVLYIDSAHIPLAIKGDNSRDIYWYDMHNMAVRLVDEEYEEVFR